MVTVAAAGVLAAGARLLEALGAPAADARTVAEELIAAHRMGLESHGVIRFAQYARDIRSGRIRPGASSEVVADTPSTAVVDGRDDFGQVTAFSATEVAIAKASSVGLACVATRRCNHVGRLGAYVETAAVRGLVALAFGAIPAIGHFVVPFGGSAGRLGTNPFAYGFPTTGDPIVADFATSVIPEGRVRAAPNRSDSLPPGAVLDASGRPTTDPAAFYGPPLGGLLPFGGDVGYKGYAIGVLVELLGATLMGDRPDDADRSVNGFTMIALDPGPFGGRAGAAGAASAVVDYLRSSPPIPGVEQVMVPGEREFTALRAALARPTLEVDSETWRQFAELAGGLGVSVPSTTTDGSATDIG